MSLGDMYQPRRRALRASPSSINAYANKNVLWAAKITISPIILDKIKFENIRYADYILGFLTRNAVINENFFL